MSVKNGHGMKWMANLAALAVAGSAMAALPAKGVVLDFETAGQYADNFRILENENNAVSIAQDAGGFVRATGANSPANGGRLTTVYDTTPADSTLRSTFGPGLSLEFDARIASSDRSVGVYLINASAAGENAAYLALFNVGSSTNDKIRFSSGTNPTAADTNNYAGLDSGTIGDAGYNPGSSFVHFTLKYTADANNHPVLDLTVGNLHASATYPALTAYSQVELGLRLSPQNSNTGNNTVDFDNVAISVPEPTSLALLAAGAGGLLLRRRRGV
jgi:hypothetical protein